MRPAASAPVPSTPARKPEWTFRRLPTPIARGGLVAGVVAVLCTLLHIGAWDVRERGWPWHWGPAFVLSLAVALMFLIVVVAPVLRARARSGALERAQVLRMGAALFALVTALWMAALDVGPPSAALAWIDSAPAWVILLARWAYNLVLTPAAFAL
ncbi:MAG: hypothetical protein AAGI34_17335, partial [Pseudomonadota bacterium]